MVSTLMTVLFAVVLALLIREFLFEPVRVKGASMRSTLENGELMLVTKLDYRLAEPKRQDVVICH